MHPNDLDAQRRHRLQLPRRGRCNRRFTATTHWAFAQRLTDAGVTYSDERVVRAGKVLTSVGATAGINLALTLLSLSHGPAVAQTVQLTLEYDPRPPYDAGTPAKAPADIGELVSSYYAQRCP